MQCASQNKHKVTETCWWFWQTAREHTSLPVLAHMVSEEEI